MPIIVAQVRGRGRKGLLISRRRSSRISKSSFSKCIYMNDGDDDGDGDGECDDGDGNDGDDGDMMVMF